MGGSARSSRQSLIYLALMEMIKKSTTGLPEILLGKMTRKTIRRAGRNIGHIVERRTTQKESFTPELTVGEKRFGRFAEATYKNHEERKSVGP